MIIYSSPYMKIEDTESVVKRAMEYSSTLQENRALKDKLKVYEVPKVFSERLIQRCAQSLGL